MARKYDSSRRRKAAERTRHDILQAAIRLHWEGITEYEPLAREAGCSLATLRKHFPNKEDLFRSCTRTFAETLQMPDMESLAALEDTDLRIESCVSELCRIHEAMFGYAWLGAHMREQSPTLDAEMTAYEGLATAIAKLILPPDFPRAPLVRGLLDHLSYRAIRLSGEMSAAEARQQLIDTVRHLVLNPDFPVDKTP